MNGNDNKAAAAQEAVAWQRRYVRPAPDGSRYEWHEISREQYLEATKGEWASAYEYRELFDRSAPVAAAPSFVTDGDPTWRHGTKAYTVTVENGSVQIMVMDGAHVEFIGEAKAYKASTPAAPGIDLQSFRKVAMPILCPMLCVRDAESVARKLHAALIDASPKGGSDAISVEGTVVFKRSEGAGKYCVCCPDSPAHIYGRHIEWEGKSRPDQNALDLAILEQVLYVSGNEGKRVRVTIEVLQATSAEVGT